MEVKSRNNYFGQRHGQSEANVLGIIISDPAVGIKNYGLSHLGRDQVYKSAKAARESDLLGPKTIIYTSDFLRARETADITTDILNAQ
ncbi:MAG: histidine phosphatase family protein [Candidatus Aenigmarchaeota archaeon]|nr:histidine phosphatase family protein [Candidatus Aenigmarchaeota archaeon]